MPRLRQYSISDIQDEVRSLVTRGVLRRQNRIYELSQCFSDHDWPRVEQTLEDNDYLLRDSVIDLIGKEFWLND